MDSSEQVRTLVQELRGGDEADGGETELQNGRLGEAGGSLGGTRRKCSAPPWRSSGAALRQCVAGKASSAQSPTPKRSPSASVYQVNTV